ncbi:nitroreductase [Pseudorhodoferax sp. Leaf267]|uniref:nitroreductase n=1 Tax=Pseudorhodoferax sp. Leaf267 TaxID=1736316 RepID=UPI0006FEFC28|nr:nitroreductase [Pseudorhodoferax sp. Leaf267]KQP21627.1 nitroreductase [Pseudorhodoferax sp. Leaf267]
MTHDTTPAAQAFDHLMRTRRSVRGFAPGRPVPRALLQQVLQTAACAPSNSNTQPWQLHVLAGDALAALSATLREACDSGAAPAFSHFPDVLPERIAAHQADFGARYYAALGIDRADTAARTAQTVRNYDFFGAPVGLVLTTHRSLRAHSWLDCGLFLQSLMLAAHAHGLATCPQVSFARFDALIGQHLGLPADEVVVCGMSLGYAAADAAVNRMAMPRRAVESFARFRGFA